MALIDLWCFGHYANALRRVFSDMLPCARIDEIELQVGGNLVGRACRGKIPSVDIIVAQVLDVGESCVEAFQHLRVAWEGSSFYD